jgi:DNA-binding CsgD family transcriptional regulator
VTAYLEVWTRGASRLVTLTAALSIGKHPGNGLVIEDDPTVSRLHAVIEPVGQGWCVRDLGSRNGTYVNGERILAQRAVHAGDEIRVGQTRLRVRDDDRHEAWSATLTADGPPQLTRRERDALIALCRPLLAGGAFREPASTRDIAAELVVTEAAVKQHLGHLYDKFGLYEGSQRRRVRLANEALARGVVTVADLASGA